MKESNGSSSAVHAFLDRVLVKAFGSFGLVVDAAFEATQTRTEKNHPRGVEEHG